MGVFRRTWFGREKCIGQVQDGSVPIEHDQQGRSKGSRIHSGVVPAQTGCDFQALRTNVGG